MSESMSRSNGNSLTLVEDQQRPRDGVKLEDPFQRKRPFPKALLLLCCIFFLSTIGVSLAALDPGHLNTQDCENQNASGPQALLIIDWWLIRSGLTYGQAKAIQMTWDFLLGQGGRILHGWILPEVLLASLVFLMERTCVPEELYIALAISSDTMNVAFSCAKSLWQKRN